jgi:hypothetical protein
MNQIVLDDNFIEINENKFDVHGFPDEFNLMLPQNNSKIKLRLVKTTVDPTTEIFFSNKGKPVRMEIIVSRYKDKLIILKTKLSSTN